jgi:hypothetical protein
MDGWCFCLACAPTNEESEDSHPIWNDDPDAEKECCVCGEPLAASIEREN